ncbi:nucleotidyltransferase domain-containing protein [Emticicia sp. C21]|uniref:nucleotidyltransferase domain-containing protein n=1 Tax=Emticicia sp. C21 TaxID=2302915 RepID=UPI000E34B0D6|nr:nucleotidyltransferase domain-containing protein [Emticicia sp. C21]RFS16532.1 nucleotidyltransferase domain-containing protein [Emticicia sp. C21]
MTSSTIFDSFIQRVIGVIEKSPDMIGLAVAGSWITKETDAFSDLDLILVSENNISQDPAQMKAIANQFGTILSAFTGEHVGELRVLICLYDEPLLHVDLKFLLPDEFYARVENPLVVWERENRLTEIIRQTTSNWPYPDYQWIEDRFWVWIHYATLKIGRGELFETLDFISFLRTMVLGPLLLIKNGHQPRGVRKLETKLSATDLAAIQETVATLDKKSLVTALWKCISIYEDLRTHLFNDSIELKPEAEKRVKEYLHLTAKST